MKCLVKNVTPSDLNTADFKIKYGEEKKIEYTEKVRYYVAAGYIQLKDLYTEVEKPKKKSKQEDDD